MPRKSSIHFQPVTNIRFAVSHSERTDLSEPAYLLPKKHQLPNIVVSGSLSENELAAMFIRQKEGMTRQAKTAGASPFWEGVVVLPNTDGREQSKNLQSWKKEYEKLTGQKVLHMAVHLDEGYLDELGKPQYNPHAHVIVSRMDSKNKVINLDRRQLAKVQDLTAETLQMERGSTLEERKGKRGRAHVPHREFRVQADGKRLDVEAVKTEAKKVPELAATVASQAEQIAQLKAQYLLDREEFKRLNAEAAAAGLEKVKSQKDYSALKVAHEAAQAHATQTASALETLQGRHDRFKVKAQAALDDLTDRSNTMVKELKTERSQLAKKVETMTTQITQLEAAKLEADRAKFADMAKAYQEGKAAGIAAHLIVPGAAPAPVSLSSQSNKPVPLTPAPIPREATKTAQEAPNRPEAPIPLPKPTKSLVEAFEASLKAMLDWIKSIGAEQEPIGPNTRHDGPVKQLDDLHAVQKTGRRYAIHKLSDLDKVPAIDDPKTSITYRDGVGHVTGGVGVGVGR